MSQHGPPVLPLDDPRIAVLLHSTHAPVTARPRWWTAWAQAFDQTPLLVAVPGEAASSQVGELLALAPLATATTGRTATVSVLGGTSADAARLPACDDTAARALAEKLAATLAALPRPWHLFLEHLPPGDPTAQRLAELLPGARWTLRRDRR